MKRYTIKEIEEQAIKIHGNKYEYDFSTYKRKSEKMRMICHCKDENGIEHGEFWQSMENHTKKKPCGCPKCAIERNNNDKRFGIEEINYRLSKINEGKYYLPHDTIYRNNSQTLTFICKKHGEFKNTVGNMLRGECCPKCRGEKLSERFSMGVKKFKEKLFETHNGMIDTINDTVYVNNRTPLRLVCHYKDRYGTEHGEFTGIPYDILNGESCGKCKCDKLRTIHLKTFDSFLEDAIKIHGEKYEYDKASYVDRNTKIRIYCKEKNPDGTPHGWFEQTPHSHLTGMGCSLCSENKMERELRLYFKEHKIDIIQNATFEWLKYKGLLKLDFYLPEYNVGIECQGEQHFKAIEYFGSLESFEVRKMRDEIKLKQCKDNGVKLYYYSNLTKYDMFLSEKVYHNKEELLSMINNF